LSLLFSHYFVVDYVQEDYFLENNFDASEVSLSDFGDYVRIIPHNKLIFEIVVVKNEQIKLKYLQNFKLDPRFSQHILIEDELQDRLEKEVFKIINLYDNINFGEFKDFEINTKSEFATKYALPGNWLKRGILNSNYEIDFDYFSCLFYRRENIPGVYFISHPYVDGFQRNGVNMDFFDYFKEHNYEIFLNKYSSIENLRQYILDDYKASFYIDFIESFVVGRSLIYIC